MTVNTIELEGFRNFAHIETPFDGNVNILLGQNAQGKTNLLEAIFYLTGAHSFRTKSDRELIGFDAGFASVKAEIFTGGRRQTVLARLQRSKRRELYINGVRMKTASEFAGRLTAVLFSPEDLEIISGGAQNRRKLLDLSLCQLRPRYALALREYTKLHERKTRILRDFREKPSLLPLVEEYTQSMCRYGAELIHVRAAYTKLLSAKAAAIHREFSGDAECLEICYKTVKTVENPDTPAEDIYPLLLKHAAEHRKAEIDSGLCLSGAHKDDLEIRIGGIDARAFASQGQRRTAALSLKLAERDLHYEDKGEYPVLLLDDVLSELDRTRQNFVLNRISDGQVFITCCEDDGITTRTGGKIIHIHNGEIM